MKKVFVAIAMVFSSVAYSFAGETEIDQKLINVFRAEFAGAQDATWEAHSNFYQVSFTQEGKKFFAFYSKSRNLIGLAHYVLSTDLPGHLQAQLRHSYADYWIADLFELKNDEGNSYYVTLQNAHGKIVLESKELNSWEVFRKYKNL